MDDSTADRKNQFLLLVQTYAIAAQAQQAVLYLSPSHRNDRVPEPMDAVVLVHQAMRLSPACIPDNVLTGAAGFLLWQVLGHDRPAWVEYLPTG